MGILLFLLVIAAAAAAYFWFRKKTAAPAEAPPVSNRFHAVTVRIRPGACPAVQAMAKSKFLAKEAPRLPLDECNAPTCQCEYRHHDDRRDDEDRREESVGARYEGKQRRNKREDRRKQNP
ncbi:MAG: hypothetical protein ACYDBW_03960 [Sulfuricaulis sp.]